MPVPASWGHSGRLSLDVEGGAVEGVGGLLVVTGTQPELLRTQSQPHPGGPLYTLIPRVSHGWVQFLLGCRGDLAGISVLGPPGLWAPSVRLDSPSHTSSQPEWGTTERPVSSLCPATRTRAKHARPWPTDYPPLQALPSSLPGASAPPLTCQTWALGFPESEGKWCLLPKSW